MRPNLAQMRRPTKIMTAADRHPQEPTLINELLRTAVARSARGRRMEADTLLRAIRVLEADRTSEVAASAAGTAQAGREAAALPTRLFERAMRAHRASAFDRAEPLYRAILLLTPSHAMVWSNLAAVLIQVDEVEEALVACRKALDISPTHVNAHINLANALQKKGAFDEAAETLRRCLAYHPNRLDLRRGLGAILERVGRLDAALAVYDEWLEFAPACAIAHMAKAAILTKVGRIDEAIGCYAHVAALEPDHAAAYSAMGILMAEHRPAQDLNEATSLCLRAATLDPGSPPILANLGVVLRLRGDVDQALLVFQGLARMAPDYAPARSNIDDILKGGEIEALPVSPFACGDVATETQAEMAETRSGSQPSAAPLDLRSSVG